MSFNFATLPDAIGAIPDGATLALTKFNPMEAVREIIRQRRRNLHLVGVPTAGFGVDLLVAAGCVRSVESGAFVLGNHGAARNYLRAIGAGEITLKESSCPLIEMQLQAGASGFSFTPSFGLVGSDLMAQRPDLKIIDDPYEPGRRIVIAPSLRPDVAIIHGMRADRDGNIVTTIHNEDRLIVQAAQYAIATVEEVRDDALDHMACDEQVIPGIYFNAISVVPGGSQPFACRGYRGDDRPAIEAYLAASRAAEDMQAYVDAIRSEARADEDRLVHA